MRPYSEVHKKQRYEYKAFLQNTDVENLRNCDDDYMIDKLTESSGHTHEINVPQVHEDIDDNMYVETQIELCEPLSVEDEIEILKGKPAEIFEAFQKEYATEHIQPDLIKSYIKIRGYYHKEKDIADGVIEWQQEEPKPFINPFKIQSKHLQIVENE